MAHGDYRCCAICDRKMSYVGLNDNFKTEICPSCLRLLHNEGCMVYTSTEFVEWVEEHTKKEVLSLIKTIGFVDCHYDNKVDRTVAQKIGIENTRNNWEEVLGPRDNMGRILRQQIGDKLLKEEE